MVETTLGTAIITPDSLPIQMEESAAYNGYSLFAPISDTITYVINMTGSPVHTWSSTYQPGLSCYLLDNGTLFRTGKATGNPTYDGAGGQGGILQFIGWDNTLIWQYNYTTDIVCQHHDAKVMPNGNVLAIAWELKSEAEAIAAGRNPATMNEGELWLEHIIEIQSTGKYTGDIVWEWHCWDHLIQDFDSGKDNFGDVGDNPGLIDFNFYSNKVADWLHFNSVDYNEELDQILVSALKTDEVYVIDHSTTIAEAAGHSGGNSGKGGDILYRWGNPQVYRAGTGSDRKFYNQHDAQWIGAGLPGEGDILVFHNGGGRPGGDYSSIDEFIPPVDEFGNYSHTSGTEYGPADLEWTYTDIIPTNFYGPRSSGAQRLPNGNTFICEADAGRLFEVTSSGAKVWEFNNIYPSPATNNIFKARRYPMSYPLLASLDYNISLTTGWNLISIPLRQSNITVEYVLASIDGKWDKVMAYESLAMNPWVSFAVSRPPESNTLDDIDRTMGIWLHATQNCSLETNGILESSTAIMLHAGWNLVGYPSLNEMTVSMALAGTGADIVETYQPTAPYIQEMVGTDIMGPGEGYWVHVSADTVWVVDW